MRSTVIPAQITTVEDRIAGNLTLTQILLLIAPVFLTCVVYAVFPHPMSFNLYKVVLLSLVSTLSLFLAIRIKGRLILNWIVVISAYLFRPKLYVFNKQSSIYRTQISIPKKEKVQTKNKAEEPIRKSKPTTLSQDYTSILRGTKVALRFTHKGIVAVKNI